MRTIAAILFMTLDGVIQAPGAPDGDRSGGFEFGGWSVPLSDEATGEIMMEQMPLDGCELLLGRRTYDIFAGYWPDHADGWPGINQVRKYVASRDPSLRLEWENSVLLTGDVAGELRKLKAQDGPPIRMWGSGDLLQTLLKNDMVDELWLKIYPVTLGSGRRIFESGAIPRTFRVTYSRVTPSGVIAVNYSRVGEVVTGSFAD